LKLWFVEEKMIRTAEREVRGRVPRKQGLKLRGNGALGHHFSASEGEFQENKD